MTPEEEIKKLALERGAELVGIASVAEINRFAPTGHRPDDFLIGAKSVIVFAGTMALRGAWQSPNSRTHYANRLFPASRKGVAMAVARFIENKYGHYSLVEDPGGEGFYPGLSQKLCAEMAGLGTRSLAAGILLNEKLGIISTSNCLTTMPLSPDGPLSKPVCPHPACVKQWREHHTTPCLTICPECLSGELDGGSIKWMRYDRRICTTRAQTTSRGALQKLLLEAMSEPDLDKRKMLLLGSFFTRVIQSISSGNTVGQCGECLRGCPICLHSRLLNPKEAQPATALSNDGDKPSMTEFLSPDLYHKYKHQVLEMSLAIQNYEGTQMQRDSSSLTDREIAEKLGLKEQEVTEIRTIAEVDLLPADTWIKSDLWKSRRTVESLSKRAKKLG